MLVAVETVCSNVKKVIKFLLLILFLHRSLSSRLPLTPGGFTQAGVSQRFGRATNFQNACKVSHEPTPRLRQTAR